MILFEAWRRTLFPTRGIQKIIPKSSSSKAILSGLTTKNPTPTKAARDPASAALFLYWEVVALGTDPLNLKKKN